MDNLVGGAEVINEELLKLRPVEGLDYRSIQQLI